MTTREYLDQVQPLAIATRRQREKVERLEAICYKMTSIASGMPRGGSGDKSDAWDALSDELSVYQTKLLEQLRKEHEIEDFLKQIPTARYRELLAARYIDLCTWEEVGDILGCSDRHAKRLHGAALNEARMIFGECP